MPSIKIERITFKTADQITIVGEWSVPEGAQKSVLLLHMMPATRRSFLALSQALNAAGCATLAIDLRGHGESSNHNGTKLDYTKFSDDQHQASSLDVDAALNFLISEGFSEENISFVGASIGANLSLDALSRYNKIPRAVLLSPGLNYRGVATEKPMKAIMAQQKVLIVAAEGDEYSADSSVQLQQLQKNSATVTLFGGSDHGTTLFTSQKNLIPDIVKFLQS